MDKSRLSDWQPLFAQALRIIDAAEASIGTLPWSFGGGTVLMLKYEHRYSKDIDIFLRDPQFLGHVTPRLSPIAEAVSDDYHEHGEFVKLRLAGGEIDFIGTGWLTKSPYQPASLLGRTVNLETPAEIIGKKVRYRAASFKARDLFDLAIVLENAPDAIHESASIIREYRPLLRSRVKKNREALEEEFEALDLLDTRKTLDDCVAALEKAFTL